MDNTTLGLSQMAASPRKIHPARCLRQRHLHAACSYCQDVCPTGAIQFNQRTVFLNADRCAGCGVCLTICPVECFETGSWSEQLLLNAVVRENQPQIDVFCKLHPHPQRGDQSTLAFQVNACLAAISPGMWFEIGLDHDVQAHLEHCAACPLARSASYTQKALELANEWLESVDRVPSLSIERNEPARLDVPQRAVISAERRIVNRRTFLTFAFTRSSGSPRQGLIDLPEEAETVAESQKSPPHLPAWLRRLSAVYGAALSDHIPAESGTESPGVVTVSPEIPISRDPGKVEDETLTQWPTLSVESNCVACGACARYCPSGALSIRSDGGRYQHVFTPGFCLSCGLCAQVCNTGALIRHYATDETPFEKRVMQDVPVNGCKKCGSPALESLGGLCYWCATEPPERSVLNSARNYLFPNS